MSSSVTFRFALGSSFDPVMIEAEFRESKRSLSIGKTREHVYVRGEASAFPPGFGAQMQRLPQGCEVFELAAVSLADAQALEIELTGMGGLGGLHSIIRNEAVLVVEYIGDLFLFFDYLDMTGIAAERRVVVPLEDASYIAVANTLWRDGELTEQRILERAAEES